MRRGHGALRLGGTWFEYAKSVVLKVFNKRANLHIRSTRAQDKIPAYATYAKEVSPARRSHGKEVDFPFCLRKPFHFGYTSHIVQRPGERLRLRLDGSKSASPSSSSLPLLRPGYALSRSAPKLCRPGGGGACSHLPPSLPSRLSRASRPTGGRRASGILFPPGPHGCSGDAAETPPRGPRDRPQPVAVPAPAPPPPARSLAPRRSEAIPPATPRIPKPIPIPPAPGPPAFRPQPPAPVPAPAPTPAGPRAGPFVVVSSLMTQSK